jgi:hypothetical protein
MAESEGFRGHGVVMGEVGTDQYRGKLQAVVLKKQRGEEEMMMHVVTKKIKSEEKKETRSMVEAQEGFS